MRPTGLNTVLDRIIAFLLVIAFLVFMLVSFGRMRRDHR
jgi:hypothetical protein